jgi:hypothetical protein
MVAVPWLSHALSFALAEHLALANAAGLLFALEEHDLVTG